MRCFVRSTLQMPVFFERAQKATNTSVLGQKVPKTSQPAILFADLIQKTQNSLQSARLFLMGTCAAAWHVK